MSEALVQALIRLIVVFVTAGIAAVLANLTILQGAIPNPLYASVVLSIVTAVLSAILKFLGGPSQPAARGTAAAGSSSRPNIFSI